MTEKETAVKKNENLTNLLHEFYLYLLSKMEELAHHIIIIERLIRDLGIIA